MCARQVKTVKLLRLASNAQLGCQSSIHRCFLFLFFNKSLFSRHWRIKKQRAPGYRHAKAPPTHPNENQTVHCISFCHISVVLGLFCMPLQPFCGSFVSFFCCFASPVVALCLIWAVLHLCDQFVSHFSCFASLFPCARLQFASLSFLTPKH